MDNSQEEEPEAAEKLSLTLLSPVKTNLTFSRKCVSIRATAYIDVDLIISFPSNTHPMLFINLALARTFLYRNKMTVKNEILKSVNIKKIFPDKLLGPMKSFIIKTFYWAA